MMRNMLSKPPPPSPPPTPCAQTSLTSIYTLRGNRGRRIGAMRRKNRWILTSFVPLAPVHPGGIAREAPFRDGRSGAAHERLVEVQVVQRIESRPQDFVHSLE